VDEISIEKFEDEIIRLVIEKIEYYIELISPSDTVYIAFDGVAPFAKMDQQRNRRYKSVMLSKISNAVKGVPLDTTDTVSDHSWSTSNITPGTQFMDHLSKTVSHHFTQYACEHPDIKHIIVSGSDEPGEGEHKMFSYMRNQFSGGVSKDTVAVYGLDSDLIMLSVFHCKLVNNIFIFRETPEFIKSSIDLPQVDPNEKNACSFMDISRLSWGILHELQCNGVNSHRIYDYVFLCFFLGNDFLPHFPALNLRTSGMDTLLSTYRRIIGSHVNRSFISNDTLEIQWNWVFTFINELAKYEHDLIVAEYDLRDKSDNRRWKMDTIEERDMYIQSVPIIYRAEEKYICPREKHWQQRYYQSLFGSLYDKSMICKNYMEGLEWVFTYYTKDCPHWRWKYQYAYPPLLADLACELQTCLPSTFSVKTATPTTFSLIKQNYGGKKNVPFSPYIQLIYVLPKTNHSLLPTQVQDLIISEEYSGFFPENIEFKWAFCRYFWEAHAHLPEISLDVLDKLHNKIEIV